MNRWSEAIHTYSFKYALLALFDALCVVIIQAESMEPWLNPVESVPAMDLYFNDGYHSDIVVCTTEEFF